MKAKEFIPASKPRNFVAKNQKTAGSGRHKDTKHAEKQGDVKHKKDLIPMEGESALEKWRKASAEREKKHSDIEAKRQAAAKQGKENMSGAIDRLEKHLSKD